VTPALRVAALICDYVAVMSKGRGFEYGSSAQVFGSRRDDYTKSLFAAAPGRHWEFGKFATA
jgi:peptide/nickel transport system ATP-binding protein